MLPRYVDCIDKFQLLGSSIIEKFSYCLNFQIDGRVATVIVNMISKVSERIFLVNPSKIGLFTQIMFREEFTPTDFKKIGFFSFTLR